MAFGFFDEQKMQMRIINFQFFINFTSNIGLIKNSVIYILEKLKIDSSFTIIVFYFKNSWNKDCFEMNCMTFSCHFLAIPMFIFHKTEVLTVILRCLSGHTYDWFKSYDTKRKYFHFFFFCDFVQKQKFASFAFFAFLCFLSSFLYQLSFTLVKHLKMTVWISVLWKINM